MGGGALGNRPGEGEEVVVEVGLLSGTPPGRKWGGGRQREKPGWDVATVEASAGPPGMLWGWLALQSAPTRPVQQKDSAMSSSAVGEMFLFFLN